MDKIDKIPAGSLPPEKTDSVEEQAVEEPKVYAGKYKSVEDLEKAHADREKTIGKQGGELAEWRGRAKYLEEQLEKRSAQPVETKTEAPVDYNAMIKTLGKQYEDGDKTFEEVLLEATSMTAQQVQAMTQGQMQAMEQQFNEKLTNTLAERDMEVEVEKFHDKHRDYNEVLESGVLERIMKDNPMHDQFSAYYAYKAEMAEKRAEEEAQRVREGSRSTEKVLQKSGTSIQQTNNQRTSDPRELRESMLNAVRAVQT